MALDDDWMRGERTMTEQPVLDPGARHRSAVRAVFGRPGSMRRWLIGTALWLAVCYLLWLRTYDLMRIVVLIFALVVPFAAFNARKLMEGDEDELRAHLRKDARQPRTAPSAEETMPPELWLSRGGKNFDDAPPPPVADEEPHDGLR